MKHLKTFLALVFVNVLFFNSCAAQPIKNSNNKSLYSYEKHVVGNDTLNYRMLLPKNYSEEKAYPLVLFLHGAGERGNDNEKQLVHGSRLFTTERARDSFPAIVIFPQCPKEDYWAKVDVDRSSYPINLKFQYDEGPTTSMSLVMDLMDKMISQAFVKKDQVYVIGLSMGGMGTFEIIYRKPELFAAAIPICGGGEPNSVKQYAKTLPLWVFHGAKDNVVHPQLSLDMVSAILKDGGFPKFTLYDFANHNSWDPTFAEPDLLPWLFSNKN